MIDHRLDPTDSILYLHPKSALTADDFAALTKTVDAQIEAAGSLAGIVIEAPTFPGWDSLGAMVAHFRFVRDHHKRIRKVAVVTDSAIGNLAERLASHFVAAEIRKFAAGHVNAARQWILEAA